MNNMKRIILITGASGSGKTTVAKYLAEKYQVFHFDDVGVPPLEEMVARHGSCEGWQKWATENWMQKLQNMNCNDTVILEGSFNPEFAFAYDLLICLHANREIREKRLHIHRKQPELINQDMENFANILQAKTLALGGIVIDSSGDLFDTTEAIIKEIENGTSARKDIPVKLITNIVTEQFPQYKHLEIKPVKHGGCGNITLHLGDELLLKIPRSKTDALSVTKENNILSRLKPNLSIAIPTAIAIGSATDGIPWNWSIYKYLKGNSANTIQLSDTQLETIAYDLAKFLKELQQINANDAPKPGLHNCWRGDHVSVYEQGALKYFTNLQNIIDSKKAIDLWHKAAATFWDKADVWVHGDLAAGNFLITDGKLSAVIDFGTCAAGDPACDLAIAYTFFNGKSREIFKNEVNLDKATWLRAKAWVLWKAGYVLYNIKDKASPEAKEQIKIINEVLNDNI